MRGKETMATIDEIEQIRQLIFDKENKVLPFPFKTSFPTFGSDYIFYLDLSDSLVYYYDADRAGYMEFIDDFKPDWLYFSNDVISAKFDLIGNLYLTASDLIALMLIKMARDMELEKIDSGIESTSFASLKSRYAILKDAMARYKAMANDTKQVYTTGRFFKGVETSVAGME